MTIATLSEVLEPAKKNNYAVAGLVVLGWEDARCYAEVADELGLPVILQAGPGCRKNTPIPILGKMFRYLAEQSSSPVVCHIDHGYSLEECQMGIDNGFTSLTAAVVKEGLLSTLTNPHGEFTVFAPTDQAFAKLPRGTLEELLKPENKQKLSCHNRD